MSDSLQLERDRAYKGLLYMILGGGVDPDTPLSERKLAETLAIGRTPVREALRDLARDGVVEVRPARGTFVRQLSTRDVEEIYQVRQSLEGLAARLAAERGATPELSAYGRRFREMAADPDGFGVGEIQQLGADFHLEVFHAADNRQLLDIYQPIRLRFSAAMGLPRYYDEDWVKVAITEHLGILDAIEAGDGDAAERRIRDHLGNGLELRVRILDELAKSTHPEAAAQ